MGKWKDLGVVPDSEDDDALDSDSSSPLSTPPDSPTSARPSQTDDIWEFPGSSELLPDASITSQKTPKSSGQVPGVCTTSSGRGQSSSLGDCPSSPLLLNAREKVVPRRRISESPDPLGDVPVTPRPAARKVEGISSSAHTEVRNRVLPRDSLGLERPEKSISHNTKERISTQTPVQPKLPVPNAPTPLESPQQGRRSLRPRKPIQEHPYLLENEKYSHFMKTHGVKPVRVNIVQEDLAISEPRQDLQDRDYTGKESQSTSGLADDETQVEQIRSSKTSQEDDFDELALSPSPKTSSPQRHLRASSEHSPAQQTDDTILSEDEEFPNIEDFLGNRRLAPSKSTKRQLPAQSPSFRKRLKIKQVPALQSSLSGMPIDTRDLPLPPSRSCTDNTGSGQIHIDIPVRRDMYREVASRALSPQPEVSLHHSRSLNVPLILVSSEEDTSNDERTFHSDDSASESDSENVVRQTGKRIKGVLPASWLRLDQQTRQAANRKTAARRSPPRDFEPPRPGLATKSLRRSKSIASTRNFLDEMNEDSEDDGQNATRLDNGVSLRRSRADSRGVRESLDIDDDASVVEEDVVDRMLPGSKRRSDAMMGRPRKRQKTRQKVFKDSAHKRYQQPKISESFRHSGHSSAGVTGTRRAATHKHNTSQTVRLGSPPALGIVDFIQPNAPNFVKIAARAASRRKDMGRSKPSKKNIDLGNRNDNVDALSVLTEWRSGKLRPTSSMPGMPKIAGDGTRSRNERQPLRSLSTNTRHRSETLAKLSFTQPQKITKKINIDRFATTQGSLPLSSCQLSKTTKTKRLTSYLGNNARSHRPAQLEAELSQDTEVAFTTRKKMLDLVFRKNRRETLVPTFKLPQSTVILGPVHSSQSGSIPHPVDTQEQDVFEREQQENRLKPKSTKRRLRKAAAPRRLDLDAPQFKHANDPLPLPTEPDSDGVRRDLQVLGESKIAGLGPFGTHYTQHFEIFPLHGDTYFHHGTLIGNGTLKKALESRLDDVFKKTRQATIFGVLDHHFCWMAWTDNTSIELGFLFDLLSEQLEGDKILGDSARHASLVSCADYVLRYLLESARLSEKASFSAFAQRLLKLLLNFLESTKTLRVVRKLDRTLLEINVRFLMCALVVLRLCRGVGELSSDYFQAETTLQQYATVIVQQLLEFGLSPIRSLYNDLERLTTRERGVRSDATLVISWVIVFKVLGSAQIPRAGFWDLTSSAMTPTSSLKTNDARELEAVWENMFTLLPLGEFDDVGVLSKGKRYTDPLQGWVLPQKLLKHVFDSYCSNEKQSPSFNEYCRTLLARCHHLIEQWGWYKCVGVVGTIFDFFGSRDLSHLRNEEAYKSADFLEDLSGLPCLSVQPGDRCFHVFLKILALAIQRLKDQGLSSDVRNLIARCLPNHNRQYSKEQTVRFDDLASLRNHHDLLCTLFWAAPREDRRSLDLIEKLVSPADSHKEACLINLRAWSQLARFVVSSGASIEDFRPFISWQNNIFQQILTQYLTAGTDVQQQFMSLAKEKRKDIQQHMLDAVVKANQDAAKDILYASVQASLDVMKRCPSLGSATVAFNVSQTSKVFDKLINANVDVDWGVLRVCFETIDSFVTRLEDLWSKLKQASGDTISSLENRGFEDAVEFLDDKVVRGFFAAVRRAMDSIPSNGDTRPASPAVVVEKAIILCGRIASLFIDGGKRHVKHFFSAGNSHLFGGLPHELSLAERKFVPLFVATLLKNHIFNFSSIGCSHFDIWILALVKPFQALRYENYLAEILKTKDIGYMKGATVINGKAPSYNANRDFFACGISNMRKDLRQVDVSQRKPLRTKYEKLLKLVMQQMKTDLKSLETNTVPHQTYIRFVHEIVGLIKSHGADICAVDPFYYQVSAEYSPVKEDPQLHTAGILAYGLRLEEGETTAIPQLYHYLYNHFKSSLANGQIEAEVNVVRNGMGDDSILAFVMGRMLPAIIQTSSSFPHVWPLLGVYSTSLQDVLGKSGLPREIPQNHVHDVVMLLESVIDWFRRKMQSGGGARLTATDAHVFTELFKICNSIRPTLICWLFVPPRDRDPRIQDCLDVITALADSVSTYLHNVGTAAATGSLHDVIVGDLFASWQHTINVRFPPQMDTYVISFAQNLEREFRTNWVVTEDTITVKAAVTSSAQVNQATGQRRGVKNDLDGMARQIFSSLLKELKIWVDEVGPPGHEEDWNRNNRKRRRRPRRVFDDETPIECLLYGI